MQESYGEGPASHPDPESCGSGSNQAFHGRVLLEADTVGLVSYSARLPPDRRDGP